MRILLILTLAMTLMSFTKPKNEKPVFIDKMTSFVIKYYKKGIIEVTYTSPKESNGFEITLFNGNRPITVYYTGKMKKGENHTVCVNTTE